MKWFYSYMNSNILKFKDVSIGLMNILAEGPGVARRIKINKFRFLFSLSHPRPPMSVHKKICSIGPAVWLAIYESLVLLYRLTHSCCKEIYEIQKLEFEANNQFLLSNLNGICLTPRENWIPVCWRESLVKLHVINWSVFSSYTPVSPIPSGTHPYLTF